MKKTLLASAAAALFLASFLFAPVRHVAAAVQQSGLAIINSVIDSTPIGQTTPAAGNFTSLFAQSLGVNSNPSTFAGDSGGFLGWDKNATGDEDFIATNNGTSPSFAWYFLLGSSITQEMLLDQTAVLHVPNGIDANITGNVTGNLSGNVTGGTISGTTIFGSFSRMISVPAPATVAGTSAGYTGWGKNGTGDMDFIAANNGSSPSFSWYYLLGSTLTQEMFLDQSAILHVPDGVEANLTGNVTGNVSGSSGSSTGNAASATQLAATPTNCGSVPATGIAANGNAQCFSSTYRIQSMLIGSGICTTGSNAFNQCSFTSPNWGATFADANYAVSCTASPGEGTSAALTGVFISGRTATNFTITLQNGGAGAAGAATTAEIDCVGVHN
jgi:hypothetical protein